MATEQHDVRLKLALSVDQSIHASGIGRTKLYEAIKLGELQSIKIGSRRLIMVDALKEWLSKHKAA